jgi:hypothetical protein
VTIDILADRSRDSAQPVETIFARIAVKRRRARWYARPTDPFDPLNTGNPDADTARRLIEWFRKSLG